MRRSRLSKGELLLLTLPVAAFGLFAAWQTSVRLKAPSLLQSAPVSVDNVIYGREGARIFGYGTPRDATGRTLPGTFPVFLTWDVRSGDLTRQRVETDRIERWAVSPDGRMLAIRDANNNNVVRDLESNAEIASFKATYGVLDWTPDSKSVIHYGLAGRVRFYEARTGELQRTIDFKALLPDAYGLEFCRFSPDGQKVAFLEAVKYQSVKNGLMHEISYVRGRVVVARWPQLQKIVVLPGELCSDMLFSADSASIAALHSIIGGNQLLGAVIATTDLRTKRTRWTRFEKTPQSKGYLFAARFSPDGRLVATQKQTGFELWNAADGKWVGEIPAYTQLPGASFDAYPRFSPDGRFLIRAHGNEVERFDLTRFLPLEKQP